MDNSSLSQNCDSPTWNALYVCNQIQPSFWIELLQISPLNVYSLLFRLSDESTAAPLHIPQPADTRTCLKRFTKKVIWSSPKSENTFSQTFANIPERWTGQRYTGNTHQFILATYTFIRFRQQVAPVTRTPVCIPKSHGHWRWLGCSSSFSLTSATTAMVFDI